MQKELLTQQEHKIIKDLGDICVQMCHLTSNTNDNHEIASQIHDLQARIMSHAAARAYPDLYRKL